MLDTAARPALLRSNSSEEVGRVLLELSVVEQRDDAVMKVLRDGLQVSEVAGRSGVSRQSLHTWLRRYEEGGLGGEVYVAGSTYAPSSDFPGTTGGAQPISAGSFDA
jgi:Transposase